MKSYVIQIVGAALLAVFADILTPDGWKKYMGIITGMILLTVMITPIAKFSGVDVLSGYRDSEEVVSQGQEIYADMIKKEFSKSIALDVKERIRQEFSLDVAVEAEVETNDAGNIEKIIRITITGDSLSEKIADRIKYIYDVDEVLLNAY